MFFAGMPIVMPHVKAGRLRALAVTVTRRSPAAPDVPTMEEAGVPGFDISNWFGVYVPAATPKAVIAKLNSELSRVLNLADVKERLAEQGLETVGNSVERSEEHTSELQSRLHLVCRLLLEKKKKLKDTAPIAH